MSALRPLSPILSLLTGSTALAGILLTAPAAWAQVGGSSGLTELGSVDASGQFPNDLSSTSSLSADGRYLSFHSPAALLPGDTNGNSDVFVLDRSTGTLTCASTTQAGNFGNALSFGASISGDGRWVVFSTGATNFEPLDSNADLDVYIKDLQTGILSRVSNAHLSPAAGNGESLAGNLSADGRYVVFQSTASDLVPNDTNGHLDVFRRDMQTGLTQRVSNGVFGQANGSSGGGRISGDGTHVAFTSSATNLVLFDTNSKQDVFVVKVGFNPALVSLNIFGQPANGNSYGPDINQDGSRVCFTSSATNLAIGDTNALADVFSVDVDTLDVERVSLTSEQAQVFSSSTSPRISRDGRVVAFVSSGSFAPFGSVGTTNVYLRDLEVDRTWTASRPSGTTTIADDQSSAPALALNGALVGFSSRATNMVPGDTNGEQDIFVRTVFPDAYAYGSGSTTLAGCQPQLGASGFPSPTSGDFFTLEGDLLPNQKVGLLFYGFQGQATIPFDGATLHVAPPLARSPLIATSGNLPGVNDCSGFFAYDMNGFAAGLYGGNPRPELSIVGQQVNAQFWGRDVPGGTGTFLTGALEYVVGP